jgi:hypothetical protein
VPAVAQGLAAIVTKRLEPYVLEAFYTLLARRRRPPLDALVAAEAKVTGCEADLARYRDSPRILCTLGEEAFAAGLETRARRLYRAGWGSQPHANGSQPTSYQPCQSCVQRGRPSTRSSSDG